ncbi:MAG: hypothetical protein KC912_21690 [Proteobacteria bacterium]|nr:hypothetical protein [Pseudomonadota bacterium]
MLRPPHLIFAALMFPSGAWAACEAPATTLDLQQDLDASELAFSKLDLEAFTAATDSARAAIPCLNETLPRAVVAQIHRFEGLRAFADSDPEAASLAFAAARAIQPAYVFPETLVPVGNPVRDLYTALDVSTPETVATAKPASGHLAFDGRVSEQRSKHWPTLFQRFDDAGAPVDTAYLWAADALPAYEVFVAPVVAEPAPVEPTPVAHGTEPVVEPPKKKKVPVLAITAGGSAAAAAVFYGLAAQQRAKFLDEDTEQAKLDGLYGRNHAFVVVSGVAGAAALGTGLGAVFTGTF